MRLVVLGAPGAGKGTQASQLAEYYHCPHVSQGYKKPDRTREGGRPPY